RSTSAGEQPSKPEKSRPPCVTMGTRTNTATSRIRRIGTSGCASRSEARKRPNKVLQQPGHANTAHKLQRQARVSRLLSVVVSRKTSELPMRLFSILVSALFTAGGVWMIASGNSSGWGVAGFFGVCLLVAVFEPWFPKPKVTCEYRLVITQDEV